MRRVACVIAAAVLLCGSPALAKNGHGQKGPKHHKGEAADHRGHRDVDAVVVFSTRDVQVIREHYRPAYRRLPPGLEKKYRRTGQLPPGWQRKMEPLPVVVERELPPVPRGCRRGVIDGRAVIYEERTHVIVDVAVLF